MWLMTLDGFVSVIKWHDGRICIRARERAALEALAGVVPNITEISVSPGSDYRYRVWTDRESWVKGAAEMASRIDYGNFKSAVAKKQGFSRYEKALHSVWSVLGRTQPGGPYGTGGSGYPPIPKGEPKASKLRSLFGSARLCRGKTKKGKYCKTMTQSESGYCHAHRDQRQTLPRLTDAEITSLFDENEELEECIECGHSLGPGEAMLFSEGPVCKHVDACIARAEKQSRVTL